MILTSVATAGAASNGFATVPGDSTLVVTAHAGDVWVGTQQFTVPTSWQSANINAFRVAAGETVTLRLQNQEALHLAAGPTDNALFSFALSSD